jgi:hypothetical protein
MQPSARKFGNAIRKCLNDNPFFTLATVTTNTIQFSGLGYGAGIFATIKTLNALPDTLIEKLKVIQAEFQAQADNGNRFIISLTGEAYPLGDRIKS